MFSIVITVFNAAPTLRETLESVIAQEYTDYEVILIDDGSSDDSLLIVDDVIQQNPNFDIKVYSPGRVGRAKALNLAISHASRPWIAILDADDIWHEKKLACQALLLIDETVSISMLGTEKITFNNSKQLDPPAELLCPSKAGVVSTNNLVYRNPVAHSSMIIQRQLCQYDEQRNSQLDYELYLRLVSQGHQLHKTKAALTYKRLHENQYFFANNRRQYTINSIKLRLFYSWVFRKPTLAILLFFKLLYYQLVPTELQRKLADRK